MVDPSETELESLMSENNPTETAGQAPPPTDPPAAQGWGAPLPPGQRWTLRRTLIAAGVAVGIAAAGGVAIYAASGSASTGEDAGRPGLHVMPPGGGDGGPLMMFDLPRGEFQTGKVTERGDTSITVASEDGFSRTYVVDDDTAQTDDIEEGDTVTVIATLDGDTATAESISELGTGDGSRRDGPNPPTGPND